MHKATLATSIGINLSINLIKIDGGQKTLIPYNLINLSSILMLLWRLMSLVNSATFAVSAILYRLLLSVAGSVSGKILSIVMVSVAYGLGVRIGVRK